MGEAGAVTSAPMSARGSQLPGWARALLELTLILGLWVLYSLARLLADANMGPALQRANELLHLERLIGIHWEEPLNKIFTDHRAIGLLGSYWYATLHYVVTVAVLVWLWRLGADRYGPARRALVIATLLGLGMYLSMPTAPPDWADTGRPITFPCPGGTSRRNCPRPPSCIASPADRRRTLAPTRSRRSPAYRNFGGS